MISVCVITRDEDAYLLQRMISTLPKGLEIVVVRTIQGKEEKFELMQEMVEDEQKFRLGQYTYKDYFNFAKARNYATELATNEWCVWLDSDDVLCESQHETFLQIENTPKGIGALRLGCVGYHAAEKGDAAWFGVGQIRAYRKSANLNFIGVCHEVLDFALNEGGWNIGNCSVFVIHLGYDVGIDVMIEKLQRNKKLLTIQIATDTRNREYFEGKLLQTLTMIEELKHEQNYCGR